MEGASETVDEIGKIAQYTGCPGVTYPHPLSEHRKTGNQCHQLMFTGTTEQNLPNFFTNGCAFGTSRISI